MAANRRFTNTTSEGRFKASSLPFYNISRGLLASFLQRFEAFAKHHWRLRDELQNETDSFLISG